MTGRWPTLAEEREQSAAAERAIVGAALMGDRVADRVLDLVKPAHVVDHRMRALLEAIADLRGDGVTVEHRTVVEHLRAQQKLDQVGGEVAVDHLVADGVALGSIGRMCARVVECARWRSRTLAAVAMQNAILAGDHDAWTVAEAMLATADEHSTGGGYATPHDLASMLIDTLDAKDRVRYPWPLPSLNRLSGGGARRGQLTFVGGPVSHGKSAFVDQALDSMGRKGASAALFVNEMTVEERAERLAARLARVKFGRLQQATSGLTTLTDDETRRIIQVMAEQPVAMVGAADWGARDITREARRRKFDVIAVDIVQGLPHEAGRKRHETLEAAVQTLDAFAKDTGCHVILVGHVNRSRVNNDGTWPLPGTGDVRDCAELVNRPDNVLFVWREQDKDSLDPLDQGLVRVAKYRGANLVSIPVMFTGEYQEFTEPPFSGVPARAAA